jgi:Tfp pilus assembly protein PilF
VARRARSHNRRPEERRPAPGPAFRPARSFALCFVAGLILAAIVAHTLDAGQRPAAPTAVEKPAAAAPVARRDPEAADAAFQEGYRQLQAENLDEAYRAFTTAAALDPRDPRPHMGLAKVLEKLNYRERAEDAYRAAIAINPAYSEAKIQLARVLCDFGKHAESIAFLKSALADDPGNDLAVAELAVNELKQGNAAAAIPLLERYLARTGPSAWTLENLGRARADTGDPHAAEESFRRALALDPHSELANLWLGQLLVASNRREEAEPYLRRFRELSACQFEAREVEQAIARRPDNVATLIGLLAHLAELRARQGRHEEALGRLRKALTLTPGDPRLRQLYDDETRRAAAK